MHPFRQASLKSHGDRVHRMAGGRASVEKRDRAQDKTMVKSAVRQHEEHDHPGKSPTALKLAAGGAAEKRADGGVMKGPKGGRKGRGAPHVSIAIGAPGAGAAGARPIPVPVPVGGGPPMGGAPGGAPMPPRPAMAPMGPMGATPGMGPPGLAPPPGAMMRKRGGASRKRGGATAEG